MKYLINILLISLLWSCQSGTHTEHEHMAPVEKKRIYTCPMHPEIIRDKPGQCPICGMDLVEKRQEGEQINDSSLQFLLKPTNEYVMSKIKTIHLANKQFPVDFKATADNKVIISAAEKKLELAGLTKEQVAELRKSKNVKETITIFSPYTGHLHDFVSMEKSGAEMNKPAMANQVLAVHEGMYVEKGQTVFNIYSTGKVWAVLDIHADKQALLKKGQKLKLNVDGVSEPLEGQIDFVEPGLRNDQKTISARVFLDNTKGELKIGAIVKAEIQVEKVHGNFLPGTSVLDLGLNSVVFVMRQKLFEARQVQVGIRTDGSIQILSGLSTSEEVAENAQLLMDSESFIRFGFSAKEKINQNQSSVKSAQR